MTDMGRVDANLVRTARHEADIQHRGRVTRGKGFEQADGLLAIVPDTHPPLPFGGHIFVQRDVNFPPSPLPAAFDDRNVILADLPVPQHAVQLHQGTALLAHHEQSRGVTVQAMRKFEELGLGALRAQGLDHPEADPAAAVHRHPGRLVDHDQGVVFENDRQGQRPRWRPRLGGRHPDGGHPDLVAVHEAVIRLDSPAVDPHLPAAQDPVHVAFGHALEVTDQEIVDSLADTFLTDFKHRRPSFT